MPFINLAQLTKQTKEAHKANRLVAGNINDGLFISTGVAFIWAEQNNIPNKMKAVLIEICGRLPEPGHAWKIGKDEIDNLEPSIVLTYKQLLNHQRDAKTAYRVTSVTLQEYDRAFRLLQRPQDNEIITVPDDHLDLIDLKNLNFDIEGEPTGPACTGILTPAAVYWSNSLCTIAVVPHKLINERNKEIVSILSIQSLTEEDE